MTQSEFFIIRGGVLLEPEPNDERDSEGTLNPAVAGNCLLYRAVGRGNYSRLMAARLTATQTPGGLVHISARKLHRVVLEPQTAYERTRSGSGGIEDPRVAHLPGGPYVMFYTGYGRAAGFKKRSPVVAVATSNDGLNWHREGRLIFAQHVHQGRLIDFNQIANKDTVLFSEPIKGHYALLHRPMFSRQQAHSLNVPWRAIWYAEADTLLGPWGSHQLVLQPQYDWENGGVGAGVPPLHLSNAWLHIYHGFTKVRATRRYSAGVFMTPHDEPARVIYRAASALLEPSNPAEQFGTVPRVVFPTAVWQYSADPTTLAVFWGAADTRIMWGILHVPKRVAAADAGGQHLA